jgi:nucleoside-diphosphate-sugar epimerase
MQRAIITGATSMMGVALIDECIKNKVFTTAVVRPNSKNLDRLPISNLIDIIECDIESLKELPKLIKTKGGVFYHFAWSVTGKKRNENIESQSDNIKFTLDAINASSQIGCELFIGAGSQAEYGKVDVEKIGPLTSINPTTPYGISKLAAGKLAMIQGQRLGIKCIWTRIFSVYGKYDKPSSMISLTLNKIFNNEKTEFTQGIQLWDYLYSEDAGRAFYLLGDKGKDQTIYCIGSGNAKPLHEYITIIESFTKPKYDMGIGLIPYNKNSVMNLRADISNLTEHTGFIPKFKFEEGIKKLINSMKA